MTAFRLKTVTVDMFFDRKRITRAADRATSRALSQAGAFIRTTARRSIRKRKAASPPGKPPSSHAGHLRRLILFGYDRREQAVVIGPMPFRSGEAPPLLEFGGRVTRKGRRGKRRRMRYVARPFMGPAMEKEKPKFPRLWADSVKG